eukprot:4835760-Ditylum_brightwellii.AAC.1
MEVEIFKSNKAAQENFSCHMLNHAARTEWKNGTHEVSPFLDAAISSDQARLLNPTRLDTITGDIMEDTKGEGARQHLPARRLNMIDACIS